MGNGGKKSKLSQQKMSPALRRKWSRNLQLLLPVAGGSLMFLYTPICCRSSRNPLAKPFTFHQSHLFEYPCTYRTPYTSYMKFLMALNQSVNTKSYNLWVPV